MREGRHTKAPYVGLVGGEGVQQVNASPHTIHVVVDATGTRIHQLGSVGGLARSVVEELERLRCVCMARLKKRMHVWKRSVHPTRA